MYGSVKTRAYPSIYWFWIYRGVADTSTLHWQMKRRQSLSVRGDYIATTAPYLNIWCLQYFPLIQRRQRNHHTPLPYNLPARLHPVPRVRPGCYPGTGTTCSGYKHFTLIDEKQTSIPLSVRGAYIATTAPYLKIWWLQYFLLIQRRQRNRHRCTHVKGLCCNIFNTMHISEFSSQRLLK